MTVKPALICVPAFLVLALTACDPGSAPVTPALTGHDCIVGDWTADLDDLAVQMAAFYEENGTGEDLTGTVSGDGEHATFNADGTATARDDATIVFTGTRSGSPLTMTSVRTGGFTSDWDLAGQDFLFTNSSDYTYSITTTVEWNGVTTTLPPQDTTAFSDDVAITAICDGDVMTMKPDISPFTTTWNRD